MGAFPGLRDLGPELTFILFIRHRSVWVATVAGLSVIVFLQERWKGLNVAAVRGVLIVVALSVVVYALDYVVFRANSLLQCWKGDR